MKSEKGITLISLTIYVITMAIVVGVIAIISTFFYSNMEDTDNIVSPMTEYTKFNSFFSDEINHEGIEVVSCGTTGTTDNRQNYIVFSNEVQYTYIEANRAIYRNKVKIAKEIDNCEFDIDTNNGKRVVKVQFEAGGKTRENTYTLK